MRHVAAVCAILWTAFILPAAVHAQATDASDTPLYILERAYGIDTEEKRQAIKEIDLLRRAQRWQDMADACSNAVSLFPSPIYFQRWITALERLDKPAVLASVCALYMEKCPGYRTSLYANWTDNMRKAGRAEEAVAKLEEWLDKHPDDGIPLWKALAELQAETDRLDDAERTYRASMQKVNSPAWTETALREIARIKLKTDAARRTMEEYFKPRTPSYGRQDIVAGAIRVLHKSKLLDRYTEELEKRSLTADRPVEALIILIQIAEYRKEGKRVPEYYRRLARADGIDIGILGKCREIAEVSRATNEEIMVIERLLAMDPKQRRTWLLPRLADLYLATGEQAKALSLLDTAATNYPSADTLSRAAGIALAAKDTERAEKWIAAALKSNPGYATMGRIASQLVTMGRVQQALDALCAIPTTPSDTWYRENALEALRKAGFQTNVMERLRQTTEADPTNLQGWTERARFCHRAGDYTNAAACWKTAIGIKHDHDMFRSWIGSLRAMRDPSLLAPALEEYFKAYPGSDTAAQLTPLLIKAGRIAEAIAVQGKALECARNPSEKARANTELARLALAEQKSDEAAKFLAGALGADSSEATRKEVDAIRAMADSFQRQNEFVRMAVEKADSDKNNSGAQRAAAQALRMAGRHKDAAAYYRRALAIEDQTATRWDLAFALTAAREYRDAAEVYTAILGQDISFQEKDTAIKAIAESHDSMGDASKTLEFLTAQIDNIKTPGVKKWAQTRIRTLRDETK